ncbi:WD repeat protein [Grosmannia clavigera kw1407]|uniref:WD repeat protein n=1 Tax=Grosmannia clavigera (strain kw1407 / UAMH 11150) TaxID=655863 RepID=F0XGS1_GROCL|nr:WD repeat protein [Grosmannia clavigera kw1407]EFX02653.1 WD repeat protein [Grosmannia clavigera kw1407]
MNQLLFERSTGNLGQNAFVRLQYSQLLYAFRPASRLRFNGGEQGTNIVPEGAGSSYLDSWAHQSGVNALALERFDGRILVSGGSDATIRIWDLEQRDQAAPEYEFRPVAQISRAGISQQDTSLRRQQPAVSRGPLSRSASSDGHRFGVTHLSFYPFDSAAFLSSSYDQTLKLWATDLARLSGSFDLSSKIYSHAISPIADHLLVACATQHPAVRLVDLRSGAAVQSLVAPGQVAGAVLSVAWSPRHEHVLASGAVDGSVRIWDVRLASSLVALLDQEDSLGLSSRTGNDNDGRMPVVSAPYERGIRLSAKAHTGPVNGLTWTDDGAYIVSAGHDRRIRVWDAATGANTLVSFGPSVRNGGLTSVSMVVSPTGLTPPKKELLFWPNESEILVFGLHDGSIVTRLRGMGPTQFAVRLASGASPAFNNPPPSGARMGRRGSVSTGNRTGRTVVPDRSSARKNRVTSLVWQGAGGSGSETGGVNMGGHGAMGGVYSGHSDGQIRAWMPQPAVENGGADDEIGGDSDDATPSAVEQRDRKRRALDQTFRSLMGTQITFR